jgi:hypothetical protein
VICWYPIFWKEDRRPNFGDLVPFTVGFTRSRRGVAGVCVSGSADDERPWMVASQPGRPHATGAGGGVGLAWTERADRARGPP